MKIRNTPLSCNLRSKSLSFEQLRFGTALLQHSGCASTFIYLGACYTWKENCCALYTHSDRKESGSPSGDNRLILQAEGHRVWVLLTALFVLRCKQNMSLEPWFSVWSPHGAHLWHHPVLTQPRGLSEFGFLVPGMVTMN